MAQGSGHQRQEAREAAKRQWVAQTYSRFDQFLGSNDTRPTVLMPEGVRTPTGRNVVAALASYQPKRMKAPTAAQIHPERHTQSRRKRRA